MPLGVQEKAQSASRQIKDHVFEGVEWFKRRERRGQKVLKDFPSRAKKRNYYEDKKEGFCSVKEPRKIGRQVNPTNDHRRAYCHKHSGGEVEVVIQSQLPMHSIKTYGNTKRKKDEEYGKKNSYQEPSRIPIPPSILESKDNQGEPRQSNHYFPP
ncbi:MAG: hypothetical protein AAB597_00960 [Patescibacteria group bacterium]